MSELKTVRERKKGKKLEKFSGTRKNEKGSPGVRYRERKGVAERKSQQSTERTERGKRSKKRVNESAKSKKNSRKRSTLFTPSSKKTNQ